LASEIKGTCKAWSKTKKNLCKTRRKNEIIMEEYINEMIRKNVQKLSGKKM